MLEQQHNSISSDNDISGNITTVLASQRWRRVKHDIATPKVTAVLAAVQHPWRHRDGGSVDITAASMAALQQL